MPIRKTTKASGLIKVSTFLAIIVVILIVAGFVVTFSASSPVATELIVSNSVGGERGNLDEISTSTPVQSDLDAYIRASESMPNPNDFNDSYSDLNQ